MPTVVTKVVDPAGGAGVDYTSLTLWESGEQKNLVSADEISRALCKNRSSLMSNDNVLLSGWVTDNTRYILIEGETPHGPTARSDLFRMLSTTTAGIIRTSFTSGANHLWIKNIEIRHRSASGSGILYDSNVTGAWCKIENCYIYNYYFAGDKDNAYGIRLRRNNYFYVWNTVISSYTNYASGGPTNPVRAIWVELASANAFIYNCTIVDCFTGIHGESGTRVKNCIAQNAPFETFTSFHADSSNNIISSGLGTPPGSNPAIGDVAFVNYSIYGDPLTIDLHLDPSDTLAQFNGLDLSSDTDFPITEDMDGIIRVVPWEIGVSELLTTPPHVEVDADIIIVEFPPGPEKIVQFSLEVIQVASVSLEVKNKVSVSLAAFVSVAIALEVKPAIAVTLPIKTVVAKELESWMDK